jgi:hypothetical protein
MLEYFQHGHHVKRSRRKWQAVHIRTDNRQARDASSSHRREIARPPIRDLSSCYRKAREVRQERPQEGAATASNIEQVRGLQAPQDSEYGANTRQFRILFEFVKPQSRLETRLNSRVRLIQSPSHKRGRKLGEIAVHGDDARIAQRDRSRHDHLI